MSPSDWNRCVKTCLMIWVFHAPISVGALVTRRYSPSPSWTYGNWCIPKPFSNAFCYYYIHFYERMFSLFESSRVYQQYFGFWGRKHQHGYVPMWRSFNSSVWFVVWLVESMYALVMMQVSCRNIPVSVSVLIWIFTFEFGQNLAPYVSRLQWFLRFSFGVV